MGGTKAQKKCLPSSHMSLDSPTPHHILSPQNHLQVNNAIRSTDALSLGIASPFPMAS